MIDSPIMPSLPLRAGLRFYRRHPSQLVLTIAGIALGVAAVVAIDLAAYSANQAFSATTRLFRGQATHEIIRPAGRVPADVFVELRRDWGIRDSAPIIEGRLRLTIDPRQRVSLLGVDPLSAARLDWSFLPTAAAARSFELLTEPGAVLLPESLATEWGVSEGAVLEMFEPRRSQPLRIVGTFPDSGGERFLLADLATAQEVLAKPEGLSRIDLRIDDLRAGQLGKALAARGLRLRSLSARAGQLDGMTRSFRINLQALSLLTLVVGAFLVYSTIAFGVVRRRETFGLLRSLGTGRRQIYAVVLAETLALAAVGIGLGLLAGIALGSGLVRLVLRTIGDLYLSTAVDYYGVSAALLGKAALLGAGASIAAAMLPAAEAASVQPRSAMNTAAPIRRLYRRWPWQAAMVVVAAGVGAVLLVQPASLPVAFAGIFLVLIAAALVAPLLVYPLVHSFGAMAAAAGWLPGAYAGRSAAVNLSRTGAASAALMLAVATFIGVGVMIGSFRVSVTDWLDYSLDADVLIRVQADARVDNAAAEARLLENLRALPGVAGLRVSRRVALPDGEGLAGLLAVRTKAGVGRWPKASIPRAVLLERLASGNRVIVSEAFATKRGVAAGDDLTLMTVDGPRAFAIDAVFVDYSSDIGLVAMDLDIYRRHFADTGIDTIGLFAVPGSDEKLLAGARELASRSDGLQVGTSKMLREFSLEIFDRTFTITQVLRLIAGLVAVIAILNALQAQRLDSAREIAVLRSIGLAPTAVMRLGLLQTGLLGCCAGLLAVPLGMLLAWLLIFVVNRIAFGWSMLFVPDLTLLLQGVLLAALAGVIAGWWPTRQSVRDLPAVDLREL